MWAVDIITGTLGKTLGGASGGYTASRARVIDWLRQRSRPYLFSNTLMPAIAGASLKAFDLIEQDDALRKKLYDNADRFRSKMSKAGFTLTGADHPIVPFDCFYNGIRTGAALLGELGSLRLGE